MRRLYVAALLAASLPSQAASLRSAVTLEHPMVRVSDLFDDAGPAASRVLGPGPQPGSRIVVEAAQLSAIARQFGVDWRAASPADRIVIDRPGQLVPRDDVMAAVRSALSNAGASPEADIDLPGFESPIVSKEAQPRLTIEQLEYDSTAERFAATLSILTTDMPVMRMRLAGRVQEMTEIAVPVQRLAAGRVLQPSDLQMARVRAASLTGSAARGDVVRAPQQAIGLALHRMVQAGQPLPLAELGPPVVIQKGARVTMRLQSAGLQLSTIGIATESGALGQRISVMNPTSRAIVDAEILGPDLVRVSPNSAPRAEPSAANTQVTLR
jgi:flagella basal body P-ring formation protein FlgA